ncbi:MAG: HDIG domain-containing protein [Actinobacteria bacterium]|nr:HDIG domain-containing protein [Actinomycetota bacterium]
MKTSERIDLIENIIKSNLSWENNKFRRSIVVFIFYLLIIATIGSRYTSISKIFGIALFTIGVFGVFFVYIYKYQKNVYESIRLISLLGLIIISLVFLAKLIVPFLSDYLIPVAAAGMLIAILFNSRLAIAAVLVSSILTGLIAYSHIGYIAVALLSGLIGIFTVSRVSQRSDLTRSGLWLGLNLFFLCLSVSLIEGLPLLAVFRNAGWGFLGGISSAIITIGALPFLESFFNVTTSFRLLELSSPNQPLLKDLMINAPGTYNHSLIVANLVETAAEIVDANSLLARVGAYYHDIGKMKRPFFFIENQKDFNEHDKINPNLSCLIITAHVKEGIEMAKENKLPQEIVDIIQEHHGTTLVTYFYHRAKEKIVKQKITEDEFRYSGVKPKTKEAALVMLADSVEAAARTIVKPSLNKLEQLTRKIIFGKLEDGQLDESELTLADLDKVIKSFAQVLFSVYHKRIEYPEGKIKYLKKEAVLYGNPDR